MWQEEGFLKGHPDIKSALERLDTYTLELPAFYKTISEEQLLQKPAPDKWSKQEILGHLIDSAINNLKRFTEIQFLPQPYIVQPYNQNELVILNNYQEIELDHLLKLWESLNQQIIYVINNIPVERFDYPVDPGYDNKEIKTLGWIICDYVAHMEHHVKQLNP